MPTTLTWTLEKMQSFSLGGLAQPPGLAGVEPARRMINSNRLYASKNGHMLSYKRTMFVNKIKSEFGLNPMYRKSILDLSADCGFSPKSEIKIQNWLGN